jgi:hypothetical protein
MGSYKNKKYCIQRHITVHEGKKLPQEISYRILKNVTKKRDNQSNVYLGNPCGFISKSGHIPLSENGVGICVY